ncbi:hypothetical protein GP486_003654 [Trichoglossum hirsutum]|uniref:RING-type domain-containing protein n=1 Tax=Trichoglossum hirsutum TaxID=265104 RepID=A0A9P8RQE0_9PEZI|nr:hypothetical protein GP486_003654 [Trichoglossum hirsutum]
MDQLRATALPASRPVFHKSSTNGNITSSSSSPTQSPHHARQQPNPPQPHASDIAATGNVGTQQTARLTPTTSQASMNSTSSAHNSREKVSEASSSSAKARRSVSNGELKKSDKVIKGNDAKGLSDGRRPSKTFSKSVEPKPVRAELEPQIDEKQQLIQSLKADLTKLQQIATCKICIKFLYEPYTLSCGHTYCYEIKEMIDIFIHRSDLLPSTETTADHIKWRKDEADRLERDRANKHPKTGGLFRGCFREQKRGQRWHNGVIRDNDDGVDRCPDCAWELEGRYCPRCDLTFQEDGRVTDGSHWGGFSDMDDTDSDGYGFATDDELDGDLDFEDPESSLGFDVYGGESFPIDVDGDAYEDYMAYHTPVYAIQREMARGSIRPPGRRAAAHSAAGSRRRYSQSIVSDMQTSEDGEMEPLAEESEEEESESMRNFIVHDGNDRAQGGGSISSRSSSHATMESAQSRRPGRGGHLGSRNRISQPHAAADDDDDEFDEGGAVSNGRRSRARLQFQPPRRLGRRGPIALSTSTETEEDDLDLDEDTEALLNSGYSQLDHDTPEEDMESEQPDDDDDDAMTMVGIGSTSLVSSERARLGGSLTPTADQPNPPIRPPSRTQNGQRTSGTRPRGLRMRRVNSSISTTSTAHYEDGEADDDESEVESVAMDADGDVQMSSSPLRLRRDPRHSLMRPGNRRSQATEGASISDPIDLDTDVSSDTSVQTHRRRQRQRSRQPEYDPRISMLFAEHQIIMREQNSAGLGLEAMIRGRTPTPLNFPNIQRPRTANKNRGSQSSATPPSATPYSPLSTGSIPPFSPISATPGHSRNSSMSSASGIGLQGSSIPFRQPSEISNNLRVTRSSTPSSHQQNAEGNTMNQISTAGSRSSGNVSAALVPGNASPRPSNQPSPSSVSQQGNPVPPGNIPESPTSRSDSTTSGRRGQVQGGETSSSPPQHIYPNQSYGSQALGFNLRLTTRNPWAASFATVRPKQSNRTLRSAPSNETIRPTRESRNQSSQPQGREATASPHLIRQPSQRSLRQTGSRTMLRPQNSITHMRRTAQSPSPLLSGVGQTLVGPRNGPLSQEEKKRRGQEVVQRRQQELLEQQRQHGGGFRLGLAGQASEGAGQQQQNQSMTLDGFQSRRSYSVPASNGLGSSTATNSILPSLPAILQSQPRATSEVPSPRTIQRPVSRRAGGPQGITMSAPPYNSSPPNIAPITRSGVGSQNYASQLNVTSPSRANPMMAGGEPRRFP